jgi:hypothetical protein
LGKFFFICLLFVSFLSKTYSQSIVFQSTQRNRIRENFLLGFDEKDIFQSLYVFDTAKIFFNVSPFYVDVYNNSSRPFGWNNGSFISAKGLQTRVTTGISYQKDFFEGSLQPEFIHAVNPSYTTSALYGDTATRSYSKIFAGQSYAQLNLGKIALGYSNRNLWWGPGQFSSLIFSHNAPGFGHLYFSSRKPVNLKIIDLEWQLIGGGLDQDSSLPTENRSLKWGPYTSQWRYMNALTITLSPKFIPGLSLGFTRTLQVYKSSLKDDSKNVFEKYTPVVAAFFKKKINTQADAPGADDGRDQLASIYMRFVMPKSHFEFYFEYGYNDFKDNMRDLVLDAQHSSAYIVGFKKLFPQEEDQYLSLSGEITQMAQPPDFVVRDAGNWYVHGTVKQGMTHMNQLLGAGSGLGNNVQTLQLESVKGQNRLGFKVQRIQNDPRKQTLGVRNIWIVPIQWTDITYGPIFHHQWKKISVTGEIQMVHSKNYGWTNQKKFNLFTALSLAYRW